MNLVTMKSSISILAMFVVLLLSCKESTTSDDDENKNIYPMSVGNQWIYSPWLFGNGDTISIDKTSLLNERTAYHFIGANSQTYTFGKESMYYEISILYGFNSWETIATELFDESILKTLPSEKTSVPAGTFNTYKYTWGDKIKYTYWLSKNIGVVKLGRDGVFTELINYTIK